MTKDINKTNEQLSFELNDLRIENKEREEKYNAANQQLRAVNQQLEANNQQLVASEQQLRAANQQLDASNQQLSATEQQLRVSNEQLIERLKELDCFYGISKIVEIPDISLEEIFRRTVEIIPASWQYPEITVCRIILDGKEYKTPKFEKTKWSQCNDIIIDGKHIGNIEVCYLKKMSDSDTDPFLKEEKLLLHALAERLGKIIERIQAEENVRAANQQLEANNQQLVASEQQLRAANQQLDASNQQLSATEQQLRASEKGLKDEKEFSENLLITANVFILILDINANITLFNKFAEKLTAYKKEDVLGKNWFDIFIPKQNGNSIPEVFSNILKEMPEFSSYENPILCKNGSERLIKWENTVLRNENGEISGILSIGTDITEQKQAEENARAANQQLEAFNQQLSATEQQLRATNIELSASEQRFRKYFEQSLIGMTITSTEKGWIEINDVLCKMLGYTKEELRKMTWVELTHPDDLEADLSQFNRILANEIDSYILEKRFIHKDGHIIYTAISVNAHRNIIDQSVEYVLALAHDITESKQAEEALKKREEQLRNIFENSINIYYSHDIDHVINYISPQVINILGYTQEEAMIKWTELVSDNPLNEIGFENTVKAIETGKRQPTYELELVRKDGERIIVEVRESPLLKDGKTVSIVGSLTDITERKQAEEELQAQSKFIDNLIENSALSTWISDKNGIAIRANPACLNFFGATEGEVVGKYNMFKDEVLIKQGLIPELKKVFEKGEVVNAIIDYNFGDVEHLNVKNATHKIIKSVFTPITDKHNKVINTICQTMDLTDIKQAEEALKESEEKYRSLYNQSADPVLIYKNRRFVDCNQAALNILGMKSNKDLIKVCAADLSPEFQPDGKKSEEKSREMDKLALKNGNHRFEWIHKKTDGSEFPVEVMLTSIKTKKAQSFHVVWRDITERKQAEAALKKRMNELEIFNEATVGRELKMIELKKEINELLVKTGQKPKYEIIV